MTVHFIFENNLIDCDNTMCNLVYVMYKLNGCMLQVYDELNDTDTNSYNTTGFIVNIKNCKVFSYVFMFMLPLYLVMFLCYLYTGTQT